MWARRFGDLDRYDAMVVGALCFVYLAIQFGWLLRAIPFSDQIHYFSVAGGVEETAVNHRHLRIGLTLPVRLLIQVFGYSEVAYYAVPIAAGLLFLTATYLLGALLHSRAAGALGAAAAVLNAHVISDSSYLLPDLLGAGLFTLALVMIGASRGRPNTGWSPGLVGAGLVLGWSYLVREFLVIFFPLSLLVAWSAGRARIRSVVQIAAGALAMLGVELIHGAIVLGDPFARMHAVLRKAPAGGSAAAGTGAAPEAEQLLGETALVLPRQLLGRGGSWILLGMAALAAIGVVAAAISRRTTDFRMLMVPLVWMTAIYGLMTLFGWTTTERGSSVIRINLVRYWYPIIPAVTVGGAMALLLPFDSGWLSRLMADRVAGWARRGAVALVIVVALAPHADLVSSDLSDSFVSGGGGSEFREFRAWLATEGDNIDRLHVDSGHWRSLDVMLPIFTRTPFGRSLWDGHVRSISVDEPVPAGEMDGPIVAHTRSTGRMVQQGVLPDYLDEPPTGWRPIMVSSNGKLAVLMARPVDEDRGTALTIDGGVPTPMNTDAVAHTADGSWALDIDADARLELSYTVVGGTDQPSTVSIVLRDDMAGDGSLEVYCEFRVDGREPAFAVTTGPGNPAATSYYCDGSGLSNIRLALQGPIRGRLESVTVSTFAPRD